MAMESQNWIYVSHEARAAAELAHRINCWRQNVEACNTVLDPRNPTLQYPFPCESVPPSCQTRPQNSRRRKPYARPPGSPHQRASQVDFSDLREPQSMGFLDPCQVRGVEEVSRRVVVNDNCGMSGFSIKESTGLDLPHPEKNPLIAYHPDVLKEEYYRLAFLFEKLSAERSREEFRWLQTSSKDAMASVMDLGSNIRRVVNAARYVIDYSQIRGWDIDFSALVCGVQPPPTARVLPSRVRELVCSPDISNYRNSSTDWHLYPAA